MSDLEVVADIHAPGQTAAYDTFLAQAAAALGVSLKPWPETVPIDGSGPSLISGYGGHEAGSTFELPLPYNSHNAPWPS